MSLHVDWSQYNLLVERLALSVYESRFRFNQIICIARGGLRVGDVLSRIFDQPLAILSTHSYTSEGGTIRGDLVIAEQRPELGDNIEQLNLQQVQQALGQRKVFYYSSAIDVSGDVIASMDAKYKSGK